MPMTPRSPITTASTRSRWPRPNLTMRIRIRPGVVSGIYSAHSRDVSTGAPQAPRVELREANESDFTDVGTAPEGTQVAMPQWHRGVTN